MARRPRIESAGFHHIYNRGVERRVIFLEPKDKDKFLDIVCEISKQYDFILHGYAIMDNHYHILLENRRENLSDGMRQINSTYAQYFNKKQKRVGHLWQDRFKSWYIFDEKYLFTLFKYIELNPIKAKITKKAGEFRYTLMGDIARGKLRDCTRDSFVLKWFDDTKELLKTLGMKMSQDDLKKIDRFQKEATSYKKEPQKMIHKLDIQEYFSRDLSKKQRNIEIQKAVNDGFTQSEVAEFLGLSVSGVSRILKKSKVKP